MGNPRPTIIRLELNLLEDLWIFLTLSRSYTEVGMAPTRDPERKCTRYPLRGDRLNIINIAHQVTRHLEMGHRPKVYYSQSEHFPYSNIKDSIDKLGVFRPPV